MAQAQINKTAEMAVIGGSWGSLQVLLLILEKLRADFKFSILVVLHRNADYKSKLADLIFSKSLKKIFEIEDKEQIKPGCIYLAPADYHVLIEKDRTFSLDYSEKINFSRPSIDVAFKSASLVYREKLLCILLSGTSSDGADGMWFAQKHGGVNIVQDPEETEMAYMPLQAIQKNKIELILKAGQIAGYLNKL
jgi:two-component system, chemotaxis family, protein-glutamate methylesterase/glutaminase